MPADLRAAVAALMPRALTDLAELVAIPSIADERIVPLSECDRAAEWVAAAFRAEGIEDARPERTPDGTSTVVGQRPGPAGAPTVLLYAHYDVQPTLDDAAWTTPLDAGYENCLPKVGLKVLDHIRFSPDTTDFTPIFSKIEGEKPDVIITGISHVGTQPTVQWKSQQVPIPMFGISSQATNSTFWKDTNGATEGVLYNAVSGPGVAVTPRTLPFVEAYQKKYGNVPAYSGYTAYDEVYMIAEAVKRAGSTNSDKLVDAMEKTDYVGTIGHVAFKPKGDPHVHGLKTGPGFITGLMLQWQDGKQVNVWPKDLAKGTMKFPAFIKLPQ